MDRKAIENLLGRAEIDLKTARRNLDDDPECAHTFAYRAMLRSGQALMLSKGYRPDIKNKHKTVVQFTGVVLGQDHESLVNDFDQIRRKRHSFFYEPQIPCSKIEAEHALMTAESFLKIVRTVIR
ncbi:MAG: HEPN domain-containing protein [Candidatus Eisenbacteria bacterium]